MQRTHSRAQSHRAPQNIKRVRTQIGKEKKKHQPILTFTLGAAAAAYHPH